MGGSAGERGKMYTGWRAMNGNRYYFQVGGNVGDKGQLYTGWRTLGKTPAISRRRVVQERKVSCIPAGRK